MREVDGIRVWGAPDERTLAQAARCAEHPAAAQVCIMADAHVGYGVPIGGVVAYRDAVSPSAVGFDIACFPGDERVALLNGTIATFADLHQRGGEFWVYSVDKSGTIVPGRARCIQTRDDAELVRVAISGGEIIECTPDHRFLLRDGTYREARNLRRRDSLMPLYRSYEARDGYEHVHAGGGSSATHKLVDRYFNGPKPADIHLHHRDGNQFNNTPENLIRLTKTEHDALHGKDRGKHFKDPQFKEHRLRVLQEKGFYAPELLAIKQEVARRNGRATDSAAAIAAGNGQRGARYLTEYNRSPAARARASTLARTTFICECGAEMLGGAGVLWHRKKVHGYNHKVVSVEPAERRAAVYCLQVEEHHNFALAAGVFVHNCGIKAVRTDARLDDVRAALPRILEDIARTVAFGLGRSNPTPVDHPVLHDPAWNDVPEIAPLRSKAAAQLGTVGSGNHFVDLLEDDEGRLWVAAHFGSRGLGHGICSGFLNLAAGRPFNVNPPRESMDAPPVVIDAHTVQGEAYLNAMRLAGDYAYAGRDYVVGQVLGILGASAVETVHNHHNFAWAEEHGGESLIVVRKGATPAWPGQTGFVGGSMGDIAAIVCGVDTPEAALALRSTVHGAGRIMSRTAAKGKHRRGHDKVKGLVTRQDMSEATRRFGVLVRGGDVDEAPQVYRPLKPVLAAHEGSLAVVHRLRPVGVVMAGADVQDPYKD